MVYFNCEICHQRVNGSEDYINHLQFSHNVSRGFQRYVKRAFKTKTENVCESEVITLDQDIDRNPNQEGTKNLENLIREKVKQTVEQLLQPIKTLLSVKVVPELAETVLLTSCYSMY